MNAVHRSEREIRACAAEWLVRRDAGVDVGHSAFEAWLAADPRHRAAYLSLETAWRQSDRLRGMRPLSGEIDPDLLARGAVALRPVKSLQRTFWAGAAATLAAFAVWFFVEGLSWQGYATPVGGYQRIVLADGSSLELNTDTRLRVKFSAGRREIRLLRGEALFRVASDPARPFEVEAGGRTLRALGTAFNVKLKGRRSMEVLVTEGRVRVSGATAADGQSRAAVPVLSAGESLSVRDSAVTPHRLAPQDLQRRLSWQQGELIFRGESLGEAVAEFNRYNRRQLRLDDTALANLQVGGNFRANDLESFTGALKRSFGIEVEAGDDGEYLLKRGAP